MKTRASIDKNGVVGLGVRNGNSNSYGEKTPVASPLKNGFAKSKEESPGTRKRKRMIKQLQEERMKFICRALDGYVDEPENLFEERTWVDWLRKLKKGGTEGRKLMKDEYAKSHAKGIIEQIASTEYSGQVGGLLGANYSRSKKGKNGGDDRATDFLILATEFQDRQREKVWRKATGEIFPSEESDQHSDNEEEIDTDPPPPLQNSPRNSPCLIVELEVEGEKENAAIQSRRQTRSSMKALQTPLRVNTSQGLENSKMTNKSHRKSNSSKSIPTLSIPKEDFETKPHVEERLDIKPASHSPLSMLSQDDEVIENETPPPTPYSINLDSEPVPRKRTRLSSITREFERCSSVGRLRSMSRQDGSSYLKDGGDSPRSSKVVGDTGTMDRFSGYEYDFELSPSKDYYSDELPELELPRLEPPDTGREKENLPRSEQEILRDFPKPVTGPELKPYMFEDMDEALSRPKKDKVVTAFGLTLMQEQLAVYNKAEWLEDANIDFYLEMIKHRNNRAGSGYPRVYIFQSYFYKLLDKRGYESVQCTTGKDNIFEYDLVFFPIHSDHHWVLVVVDFIKKTMMCYDSMDHDNERHLRIIGGYLKREWKEKKAAKVVNGKLSSSLNFSFSEDTDYETSADLGEEWISRNLGAQDIPQQKNGRDCGVFCLQFAEYLSRRQDFDFEQRHTAYFRKRMLYETVKKSLLTS